MENKRVLLSRELPPDFVNRNDVFFAIRCSLKGCWVAKLRPNRKTLSFKSARIYLYESRDFIVKSGAEVLFAYALEKGLVELLDAGFEIVYDTKAREMFYSIFPELRGIVTYEKPDDVRPERDAW